MAEREKETLQAFDDLKTLGDLEYRVDLEPYMDPIARYGYDVETWNPSRAGGSHFNPFDDTVNIQSSHLGSKAVDAHEFRHRGFQQLFYKYRKNPDFYEKKYPGIGNFLKVIISNSRDKDLNERITEFYDKPEMWNTPVQYFNENNVLLKGRDYEEDPYEVSTVEHGEMPVYGSGFDVKKYRGKGSMEDTLDFNSEAGLRKRQKFNEYRDQPAEERGGNIFFDNVLQVEQMADDLYKEERGFAQGGPVMRGIGTLNETARNMFRGPSGVGAYQQFADGGEADMSEAELKRLEALYGGSMFNNFDIPVDGKVNFRTTDDGRQMFDAEIAKTFDGERGNITPSARYSTQRGSRSMGDVVIDDEGRQIAVAFEGNLYADPNSENKLRAAIDIENSRQKTSFSFPDGEFVETKDGVLKKFNLGFDFGRLAVNFDHVEPSGQPNRTSGSATIRIGENGIFRYQDSQGKEPEYSFNYNTDVGDGTGSLNYQEDGRNDPKLGMGYTTPMGEGVGSFSYNTDGQDNELGVKYTTNFASGGEAMGPPPTRGPDPQGIGAFQKFADGGPVYMQEGGTGKDALATNHFDLIKEKYPSVDPLKISQEEGLPPQLINVFQRLLFQENQSADASAVGTSGEIGLAQLMPVTAKDVGVDRDNLIDNVRGGARYLFKMYNRFDQDPMKAVAAYNAGPTAIVDNLDRNDGQLNIGQLPSTTQSYLGFVVQPVLNQTEVAQTIDPMMAGEDLAMSMPVAQSDYLSPEAQENIRQGTQFQGGSPTGDLSIGEQIRREKFKPNVSFEGQEMEAMPVNLRDKYSSKNMQEQLVGGQETLDKGIAGLTRSLRPPFRPEEGLTRSLRPKLRPEEEEMREPQDRYPGTNTDIGEGFGIYI